VYRLIFTDDVAPKSRGTQCSAKFFGQVPNFRHYTDISHLRRAWQGKTKGVKRGRQSPCPMSGDFGVLKIEKGQRERGQRGREGPSQQGRRDDSRAPR
jgi:hypothetical protein